MQNLDLEKVCDLPSSLTESMWQNQMKPCRHYKMSGYPYCHIKKNSFPPPHPSPNLESNWHLNLDGFWNYSIMGHIHAFCLASPHLIIPST